MLELMGKKIFTILRTKILFLNLLFNSVFLEPSSDELKRLMMIHGGNYEHYHTKTKVTHVIATNLPDSKVRELKGEKVVRPEWITDR